MMKRVLIVSLLAALILSLALPALGEEPGRLDLPAFDPADWVTLRPIRDERDAIAYAREIFALPLLGVDCSQAEWTAEWEGIEDYFTDHVDRLSVYHVTGVFPDETAVRVTVYAENGGVRALFSRDLEEIQERHQQGTSEPHDPWRAEMWQYVLALVETMEPGVSTQFTAARDSGDWVLDGARFINLELFFVREGPDMKSKNVLLQVYPVIRIIEIHTGVG